MLSIRLIPSTPIIFCSDRDVTHGRIERRFFSSRKLNGISPGRFFASNEVKTMLAYVLLNYGVKMANGDERPRNLIIGLTNIQNPFAGVMFRKGVDGFSCATRTPLILC